MSRRSLKANLERYLPVASAVLTAAVLIAFKSQTINFFKDHSLSLAQLYTSVFGWSGVQTSGLLGVYGIVFSKNDGFVGRLKGLKVLDVFYDFVKRSLWIALSLTVVSIPFIVKNEEAKDLSELWYILVACWFSIFVWAIASFVRVVLIFGVMINIKDREQVISG